MRIIVILLFHRAYEITVIFLSFPLIFQIIFLPFGITSYFYYPHANEKSQIFYYSHVLFLIPLFLRYSLYDLNIPTENQSILFAYSIYIVLWVRVNMNNTQFGLGVR
jgi:hypothetical protein